MKKSILAEKYYSKYHYESNRQRTYPENCRKSADTLYLFQYRGLWTFPHAYAKYRDSVCFCHSNMSFSSVCRGIHQPRRPASAFFPIWKGKLIRAKLFTGFSFAAGFSLLLLLQTYFQCMLTFGFDGSSTPVQIFDVLCIYPLTLGQAGFLGGLCFFGGCMLMAGLTMLLSAKLKSPFGVMILMSVFLIFPMMVQISQNSISAFRLFHLLPANSMAYFNIFHMIPYEFAGLVVPPYIMFPVFLWYAVRLCCLWPTEVFSVMKSHNFYCTGYGKAL